MIYTNLKVTTHDTQEQINYCLECKKEDCTNCIFDLRVNQVPMSDPCPTCYSKTKCRSKSCKAKTKFEILVKERPEILDSDWVTSNYAGSRIKKGMFVFVAAPGGPRKKEVLSVSGKSFTTEDDVYYFWEHKRLWWFSEKAARERR